jgi:cytochrome P450
MDIDLLSPAVHEDPYAAYAALRQSAPVHHDRRRDWFIVSRYDDVMRVLRQSAEFSAAGAASFESTLLGSDPPAHTAVRRVFEQKLNLREPAAWEDRIRRQAGALVARTTPGAPFDVVASLAAPLPLLFMLELFGLGADLLPQARRWSRAVVTDTGGSESGAAAAARERERADFHRFVASHVDRVLEGAVDVPWLRDVGQALGAARATDLATLLLVAGSETTTNLIGNAVSLLAARPDLVDRCLTEPGILADVVDETLRFESPVQWTRRRVVRTTTLAGTTLPAGAQVIALIGSANRDERRFEQADRFVVSRPAAGHLAFGIGPHFCLGAALARLEARVALEALFAAQGRISHADVPTPFQRDPAPQIRGFQQLWIAGTA